MDSKLHVDQQDANIKYDQMLVKQQAANDKLDQLIAK